MERLNGQIAERQFQSFYAEKNTPISPIVITVAERINDAGGRALLVGGFVRDRLSGISPNDFDLEVYGLTPDQLEIAARPLGKVSAVGKAFGILKVVTADDIPIDLSLPRTDSKIGAGHRGFEVNTDPFMTISDAAKRRDFTINSMALDPITGELFDPFGGLNDLRDGILRVTDAERFQDDPLRVMRAIQFVGRFGLSVDNESFELMKTMIPLLVELPKERLFEEWKKLLLKSPKPSVGIELGMRLGIFHHLHQEFIELPTTMQNPDWHPEGDVWTHTKMALDQAAKITRRENLDDNQALLIMLSTLCHDLGKPTSTLIDENGKITSHGHDSAGVNLAKDFLDAIGVDNDTKAKVMKLTQEHMWPHNSFRQFQTGETLRPGTFKKLADRLSPATIYELSLLAEADHTGTGHFTDLPEIFDEGIWLRDNSEQAGVLNNKPADIIQGRDLINLGYKPGKHFGETVKLANSLHNDHGFSTDQLLELISLHPTLESAINHLKSI